MFGFVVPGAVEVGYGGVLVLSWVLTSGEPACCPTVTI
jgi:hypothetical protein